MKTASVRFASDLQIVESMVTFYSLHYFIWDTIDHSLFAFFAWLPRLGFHWSLLVLLAHWLLLFILLCWFLFFPNSTHWRAQISLPSTLTSQEISAIPWALSVICTPVTPQYRCSARLFTTLQIYISTWMSAHTVGSMFPAYLESSHFSLLPLLILWSKPCHPLPGVLQQPPLCSTIPSQSALNIDARMILWFICLF